MTVRIAPICVGCSHLRRQDVALACDAFPQGIPDPIVRNESDHRRPITGDNGIRFEPESEADARYAAEVFKRLQ